MKNVVNIEKEYTGDVWQKALDKAYQKIKKNVEIPGFRKGNVPKERYLNKYGIEPLFNDAIDEILTSEYATVMEESNLQPVIKPSVDVKAVDAEKLVLSYIIITAPEVKLGDYKNLGIKKGKVTVTAKEVDEEIKHRANHLAELVVKDDGKVADGNIVVIDFKGFVDGKEFEGGAAENYQLEVGSHTFIPGFEEGLIGMSLNEEKDLNLKFPENYVENLKGKDVVFKVKIKAIKERVLPELNKEFYEDLGYKDVNTEEELKSKVKEEIQARKKNEVENKYINECLEKALSNMEVEINPEIIDEEVHRMIKEIDNNMKAQGISLEDYMKFTGTNHDTLHKELENDATKRVKERLLLEKVAEVEKIEPSKDEIKKRTTELASHYGVSEEELLKEIGGEEVVKYDAKMNSAIKIITE